MSGTLRMIVRGAFVSPMEPWTSAHTARFNELHATALSLGGPSEEWRKPPEGTRNCDFLRELPTLTQLFLSPDDGTGDWSVVSELQQLDELTLDLPDAKPVPNLHALTALRRLKFTWYRGAEELLETAPPLRQLGITHWGLTHLTQISKHLESLRSVHLAGARKLSDLSDLAGASRLESLRVNHCTRLRTLDDLSPLLGLTSLRGIYLRNRRHYLQRVEDIERTLGIDPRYAPAKGLLPDTI